MGNAAVTASTDNEAPPYRVPHSQEAIRILYADNDLLIVDKPHLLLSVPGRHPVNKDSLILRLAGLYPGVTAVHRLDLDTSGLMVVPITPFAVSSMGRAFQQRTVDKAYRALVWQKPDVSEGKIDFPIARDWHNRPRQKICAIEGKPSLTHYRVIAQGAEHSLLHLEPETGRSHQLRIHLSELGHPILGCDMYAHAEALAAAPRLLLHATRLCFRHPRTGKRLRAFSPAPFDQHGLLSGRPG